MNVLPLFLDHRVVNTTHLILYMLMLDIWQDSSLCHLPCIYLSVYYMSVLVNLLVSYQGGFLTLDPIQENNKDDNKLYYAI